MKNTLIILAILFVSQVGFTQNSEQNTASASTTESKQEARKIVMQLTSADTTAHKMLMKQLKNILSVAPDTKIEVVCHGPGLNMLVSEKTIVSQQMKEAAEKGVDFVACQFSMNERNVTKDQLIIHARIVPAAIIEIVDKQNEGWAYIKAGN